jgi:hypothetical protein
MSPSSICRPVVGIIDGSFVVYDENQSFQDEFDIQDRIEQPKTPGIPGKSLQLGDKPPLGNDRNTYYRSGVGKLMHLRHWSRPELSNVLRDLSRYNTNCSEDHIDAMHRAMRYATTTMSRGLTLAPDAEWNGDPEYEFTIKGYADASYKPYHDTTASLGGHAVFLQKAPIAEKSKVQQATTLSITEAELISGTDCAQDMLFAMRVLESIGLRVKKPIRLIACVSISFDSKLVFRISIPLGIWSKCQSSAHSCCCVSHRSMHCIDVILRAIRIES